MSKWPYSQMSSEAHTAGGPEKYKEMLFSSGVEHGKQTMHQWIGGALVIGGVIGGFTVCGLNKVKKYFMRKKQQKHEVAISTENSKEIKRVLFKAPHKIKSVLIMNYK